MLFRSPLLFPSHDTEVLNVEAPPTLAREEDVLAMTDQQAEGYLRSLLLKNRQYALYCYRVIQGNNELAK